MSVEIGKTEKTENQILNKLKSGFRVVLFGIGGVVLLLVILEIGARMMPEDSGGTEHYYAPDYWSADKNGVSVGKAGIHRSYEKDKKTGRMIYDVEYMIDEYGRRITPVDHAEQRDKFMLFVGCSYVYGEGVQQDQTLAAVTGQLTQHYMPYNYSFHGRGPYDVLSVVENLDPAGIKEKNGAMIYLYVDDHMGRVIGNMSVMRWKSEGIYYQRMWDGRLGRVGNFKTVRPKLTAFYKILGKSALLEKAGVDLPLWHTKAHSRQAAEVIGAMRKSFLEKYPAGKFYAVIYPGSQTGGEMISALQAEGVQVLDYRSLFDTNDRRYYLDDLDRYPSVLAYHELAERLVNDLGIL